MIFIATAAGICFIGLWLLLRRGGLRQDIPNDRSSHTIPTPRGGGVAFGIAWFLTCHRYLYSDVSISIVDHLTVIGTMAFFILGIVEDRRPMSARLRLVLQALIAVGAVASGLSWQREAIFTAQWQWPVVIGSILSVLWILWMVNLVNFMDGINGITALFALISLSAFAMWSHTPASMFALIGMGAVAVFLPYNFPKARIFMGDSGSYFLGALLAFLPINLNIESDFPGLLTASLMMSPFIADATITLVMRLLRGENVTQAHRSHFYQKASVLSGSHTKVTLQYGLFSLLLVAPLAAHVLVSRRGLIVPNFWYTTAQIAAFLVMLVWFRQVHVAHCRAASRENS